MKFDLFSSTTTIFFIFHHCPCLIENNVCVNVIGKMFYIRIKLDAADTGYEVFVADKKSFAKMMHKYL